MHVSLRLQEKTRMLRNPTFAAALSTLLILSIVATANPMRTASATTVPGTNGKIAFTRSREGNRGIHVMNPDGSSQTNLTGAQSSYEIEPAWSPDGSKIAFDAVSSSEFHFGGLGVYVTNADGSGQVKSLDA